MKIYVFEDEIVIFPESKDEKYSLLKERYDGWIEESNKYKYVLKYPSFADVYKISNTSNKITMY